MSIRSTTKGIGRALSFTWRWSLFLTVPIGCMFVVWGLRTGERYSQLGVRFQTLNNYMSLKRVGTYEAHNIVHDVALAFRPREFDEPRQVRRFEVFLPNASENALNKRLPHSGREYVPAAMMYPDGDIAEVKLRYRGDHFWHWGARKKSLRIKTKKKKLYERTRAMNVSVPKTPDLVAEFLSNELALTFGLIGPKSEMIELAVNGEGRGVHLFVEQLEEMVLRTNGRMPGDLYAGDIVKRNTYRGIPAKLFENAALWEKVAINNHFDDDEDANLRRLVEIVSAEPSAARTQALRDIVDIEEFARFQFYRAIIQSFHYDNTHNQRLYYDPWRSVFTPVVWDPVGWHPQSVPRGKRRAKPDVISSLLDVALYQDPAYLAERQRVAEDWFARGADKRLLADAEAIFARVDPSIDRDPGLAVSLRSLTPDDVRQAQFQLHASMRKINDDLRSDYLTPGSLEYTANENAPQRLRVRVAGRRTLMGLELDFRTPIESSPGIEIAFMTPEGLRRVDVSALVEVQGTRVRVRAPLPSQFKVERTDAKVVRNHYRTTVTPGTYDVLLTGVDLKGNRLEHVLGLYADESVLSGRAVNSIAPIEFVNAYDLVPEAPIEAPLVLAGKHTFEGVQRINRSVIIEPGADIQMAPGASVIIEGRLTARGTRENPIRIGPIDDDQEPWGTFAIRGSGADNSVVRWVDMRLGSGLKETRAEFSAMFSIHDVQDVAVEDSVFSDSKVVDDMVHAVYSRVTLDRCRFIRSLMDAVDIDISEAIVRNCEFIESGNDSLDLMTSKVVAIGTRTLNSRDKGISVGEDTQALLYRCSMVDCLIGVQIKDRSEATILQCEVRGNGQGIDAYKKNWRYDSGGWGYIYASIIEDNEVQLSADKHSQISAHDSFLSPMVESTKRLRIDDSCDDQERVKSRERDSFRFPREMSGTPDFFDGVWQSVRMGTRGPGGKQRKN